ncbi:hypothetical protein [Kitasatospora cheerisanensis]|uniref:Uncharacterized protein n=1 Tax=Kitasatospora cheerisanensis KCTC 2395 TaxID=1348663 RepID=A0A066Z5Y2_9ACTN|nr:hypothetical protein [Kitasatospora cheerisanensis]KDN85721.1 hypothetical protein KCH_25490 [Kitasatospora cheerisanensis KCTC 2395]
MEPEETEAGKCSRHRRPAKNCRACGTSARAQQQAAEAARRRAAQQAERDQFEELRREGAMRRAKADANPDGIQSAQQIARAAIRESLKRRESNK